MQGYMDIREVRLTENILPQTREWLFEAGLKREEAFVLWAGKYIETNNFLVTTSIFPEQKALRSTLGVGVYVSGDELFKVSRWLYENELILLAQVHSHPTNAYHSDTDDNFPLVTSEGQFSLVVPYFAQRQKIELTQCAVYRLINNKWVSLNNAQVNNVFKVVVG